MDKVKVLFAHFFILVSDRLRALAQKLIINQLAIPKSEVEEDLKDLFPHTFTTFKEGMNNKDYFTRHDAASKLVGWYLYQDGHPLVEEITQAARILLEDTEYTEGDVSFLVGAWMDQVTAKTDEEREAALAREDVIYHKLRDVTKQN